MPYSVSPCMFLYWALSEPPSEAAWVSRFFLRWILLTKGMAKIQAVIAMTLDGSVPSAGEPLMGWLKSDRNGFPYWRERCTRRLYPGYPLIDLICEKDSATDASAVFLAEICDAESSELLRGLSLYRLIDELVIFLIPSVGTSPLSVSAHLPSGTWRLVKSRTFRNGVCRLNYCRILQ